MASQPNPAQQPQQPHARRRRVISTHRIAILFVAVGLVACSIVAGIEDLKIGECKGGVGDFCLPDGGDLDSGLFDPDSAPIPSDDSGKPCVGNKGPPTAIRVGNAGNTFCIDPTEVTNAQYQQFLDAKIPIATQPDECRFWNVSFQPDPTEAGVNVPVTGVDWCDALAYCTWAGKYLCGRMENGKKIGPVTTETLTDFRSHQWLNACTADATRLYPYGSTFDSTKCNLFQLDAGRAVPVGTSPGCQGGYAGLYDLVGNVWEWYDRACKRDAGLEPTMIPDAAVQPDGGPHQDACGIKGSAYNESGDQDCRREATIRRDFHGPNVGFRCCSD
jgi:formylglycine-generating enzyme